MSTIFSVLLFSLSIFAKPICTSQLRAVFDVGSGSTKLNLARVKVCPAGSTLEEVLDDHSSVAVALEASKNNRGEISEKAEAEVVAALTDLRRKAFALAQQKAPDLKSIGFSAVATHAVRTAANRGELVGKIEALGIPVKVATHQEEGRFGYAGAMARLKPGTCGARRVWVWDIGGGSWELVSRKGKALQFSGTEAGSEAFKSELIENLRDLRTPDKLCDFKDPTPNPIGDKQLFRARKIAKAWAKARLKGLHLQSRKDCLIGVGGVHVKAVEAALEKFWPRIKSCACRGQGKSCTHVSGIYRRGEVQCLAELLSEKSDCAPEIRGSYSTTSVSNLLLVLGFLDALKMDTVHTLNVNMGHSLLTASDEQGLRFKSQPVNSDPP